MNARLFRISRVAVSAGVKQAISPPVDCRKPSIGNATAGDLEVHTTDENNTEYLVIPSGYERDIPVQVGRHLQSIETAFWLKPVSSGTVVILWLV